MHRRGPIIPGVRIRIADVVVDADRSELRDASGRVVPLRPKALAVLLFLASRPGRLVERDAILDAVWPGITVCDASLTQLVSELRHAFGRTGASCIRTVPKRGYLLEYQRGGAGKVVRMIDGHAFLDAAAVHDRPARRALLAVLSIVPTAAALEPLARCLTAEVATELARSPDLAVTVRTQSGIVEPGGLETTGGAYVLEGSVRRSGALLRINMRLSAAATGLLIWAEHFQHAANDPDLHLRFAQAVAGTVGHRLRAAEAFCAHRHRVFNRQAHDLYLRAVAALQGPANFAGLEEAESLLRQALGSDARSMLFRSAVAQCHALRHTEGWSSPEQIEEATRIARELLSRGASEPVVLGRAAFALAAIAGDHAAAVPALQQALALAPHSYFATRTMGLTHLYTANWRGAFTFFARAGRISNNHPSEHCRLWGMAFACFGQGNYARAADLASASLRLGADFTSAWRVCAASLGQMGHIDGARSAARELLLRRPHFTLESYRAQRTWADAGTAERMDAGLTYAGIPRG